MATNQLLPFANGETPNIMSFDEWNAGTDHLTGFQSGIASSKKFNYILSQGAAAGYVFGQFVVDYTDQNATVKATELYTAVKTALATFIPSAVADGSIDGSKLKDLTVATSKLVNGAVTTDKLASKSVSTDKLQDVCVTTAKIANNAVGTNQIATNQINAGHLMSNAVTTVKVADLNITEGKLANSAVTNGKIATGAVTFDRINSSAIATESEAKAGTATNKLMTPKGVAQAIAEQIPSAVPPGTILHFAGKSVPEGYLLCNGAAVSRTTYADLFAAIGTTYGTGDGSTTFNLPDTDGRVLQGTTTTSSVGTKLEAGLPNITGSYKPQTDIGGINTSSGESYGCFYNGNSVRAGINGNSLTGGYFTAFSASRSSSIYGNSSTVQPKALQILLVIKT